MPQGNVQGLVIVTRRRGSSLLYRLGDLLEVPLPVSTDERRVPIVTETAATATADRQPYITEMVHVETFGHPTGEAKACRPALVIEVVQGSETGELELAVFRRDGLRFQRCRHEEENHLGGTWHYHHV